MTAVRRIQALLGGEVVTGPLRDERDIVRLIRRGVPTQAVDHVLGCTRLSFNTLDPQVVNRRTFMWRQQSDQPLDQAESDRLLRMVGVVATAEETFGDAEKAQLWLNRENRALDGEALALGVKSVAVPQEWNVLLNVRYADMARVTVVSNEPFELNPRLLG